MLKLVAIESATLPQLQAYLNLIGAPDGDYDRDDPGVLRYMIRTSGNAVCGGDIVVEAPDEEEAPPENVG